MKILVAGGAGFLGSFLCDRLILDGHTVLCVDNLLTGKTQNIKHLESNPNFQFIRGDVSQSSTKNTVSGQGKIDVIFHLASPASPNTQSKLSYMQFPVETLMANSFGTFYLLEISRDNHARFIFASTSEVYGNPLEHPQKETYLGNVNSFGPRSCYDEGKRFGEAMVYSYIHKHNVDARIVRIFNTYGPRMDPEDGRVVSSFITQALRNEPMVIFGKGNQTRSFCFVSDMIDGLIKVATVTEAGGEVFNLGNDSEFSIRELAQMICNLAGRQENFRFTSLPQDDPLKRKPDLSKAKKILGFEPKVDIKTGLQETISFFKQELGL